MNMLPLILKLTNNFNETFNQNINFFNLESKIKSIGDDFTKDLYIEYITFLDDEFAKSDYRRNKYKIKEKLSKSILTSIGWINFKYRVYIDKETNQRYSFLRDLLNINPYQRITDEAEFELIKYAMSENMTQASKHALRGEVVHRSTVSKRIKNLKGSIHEDIIRVENTPKVLYIEMDEVHANLQIKGNTGKSMNHICPCAIVHEGHKEDFTKRKELKNVRNFASAKLSYRELWDVIYDYVSKRYDIDKIEYLFVSGDGASGIKDYIDVFPYAIFVLDKFHYSKYMNYIFKDDNVHSIADAALRRKDIVTFNKLVDIECENRPAQEKYIRLKQTTILNNIDGIINQHHPEYKCPCAMEGHVSNRYARYITSSPYAFSLDGLENKLQLLVLNANKHDLTFDEFLTLKYGEDEHNEIVKHMKELTDIKFKQTLIDTKYKKDLNLSVPKPEFDSIEIRERYNYLINKHIIF